MKQIQLLLTENVDNLGIVGDVVKVRPGYARNFLLPRGMATQPTAGNIKRLAARRAQVEQEMAALRKVIEATYEKVKDHELTMMRSANEQGVLFGGVSQHDIAQALRDEGFAIEDRMVRLGAQIKRLDTYHIPLVLANDLKTEIKLWVVSDKPKEELEGDEKKESAEPKARKAGKADKAETADETEKPAKEKKSRKEKPAEDAADSKTDAGDDKPKSKKSKKDKAE